MCSPIFFYLIIFHFFHILLCLSLPSLALLSFLFPCFFILSFKLVLWCIRQLVIWFLNCFVSAFLSICFPIISNHWLFLCPLMLSRFCTFSFFCLVIYLSFSILSFFHFPPFFLYLFSSKKSLGSKTVSVSIPPPLVIYLSHTHIPFPPPPYHSPPPPTILPADDSGNSLIGCT